MKIDQIAYYVHNEAQANNIKHTFGVADAEWVEDQAFGDVILDDDPEMRGESLAHLRFNYDLGIELELITYLRGPHWHMTNTRFVQGRPFMCHQGIHLEADEDFPPMDFPLVQEMWTRSHTNPYLREKKRTYHYRIYDTRNLCGVFTKLIKRIEP